MPGLGAFALGAAPLAGGVLLGDRGPRATDVRAAQLHVQQTSSASRFPMT